MTEATEIAVIGAGVVGLAIALRLAHAGHEVAVIAPKDGDDLASYGNAGIIADYAVLPIGTPDVLRDLPSLLFSRTSPLALRHAALPALAPWLVRFLRQSLPSAAERNARALAVLLADAAREWRGLADEVGGADLIGRNGVFHLYASAREAADAKLSLGRRRDLGVKVEAVSAQELVQLEPGLPMEGWSEAAFFPDAMTLADPGEMLNRLEASVEAAGARRVHDRVLSLQRSEKGGSVSLRSAGCEWRAGIAVVAAGAYSRPLARQAGDRVPLDTERGYHLEFDMPVPRLQRPLTPVQRGFYLCPMAGRLRAAGTVELGGLDAPPTQRRIDALLQGARAVLPDLGSPDRTWMGRRPSLPDSVPVIGASRQGHDVIHAFGHGHLGLTLAPVTARIVAALVSGRDPHLDLRPYSPLRF